MDNDLIFDIVSEQFNRSDIEFVEFVCDALDCIDFDDDIDNIVNEVIDNSTIYYSQQWKVLEHYQTPAEANWNEAIQYFYEDLYSIVSKIKESADD